MRARIDINEVEARTKIRAKYLRAIENEEWDLLPGDVYVKSFLRTYGDFLGLDSRQLIDEYKRRYERPTDHELRPIARSGASASASAAAAPPRGSIPPWAAHRGGAGRHRRGRCYLVGSQGGKNSTARRPRRRRQPPRAISTQHDHATPPPSTARTAGPADGDAPARPHGRTSTCAWSTAAASKLIPGQIFDAGQTIPTETRQQAAAHARQRVGADEGQRQDGPGGRAGVADRLSTSRRSAATPLPAAQQPSCT